jgi:hypothetical protein
MKQKIALVLVTLMGLALLGYTALRTLDLIQLTLPADQQAIGYLALVAFDGGLVGWTLFYLHGAKGAWQRGISAMMIVVSLAGVLIAFGADTLYQANARGTLASLDPALVATAIWGMVLIIGANVGAVTAVHLTDPNARKAQAEEEARDRITEAALLQIASNAESLAAELAPQLGAAWLTEMRAQYAHGLATPQHIEQLLPPQADARPMPALHQSEPIPSPVRRSRNGQKAEAGSEAPKA